MLLNSEQNLFRVAALPGFILIFFIQPNYVSSLKSIPGISFREMHFGFIFNLVKTLLELTLYFWKQTGRREGLPLITGNCSWEWLSGVTIRRSVCACSPHLALFPHVLYYIITRINFLLINILLVLFSNQHEDIIYSIHRHLSVFNATQISLIKDEAA